MSLIGNYTSSIQPKRQEHVFSRSPKNDAIEYSTFDRSHRYLTTHDEDFLIPVLVDEVYPGDIVDLKARHLTRMTTPVHPFMDRIEDSYYYFFVPSRIIWDNFPKFFGERRRNDGSEDRQYQVPMLNTGDGVDVGSIFDYCGIPTGVPNLEFSALPFRALNLIYNEWFRDENLCDWLPVGGTTGANDEYDINTEFGDSDNIANYSLFKKAKKHDYFTSALPFQQKGEPTLLSLTLDNAPVVGNGMALGITDGTNNLGIIRAGSNDTTMAVGTQNYGKNVGTAGTAPAMGGSNIVLGVTKDGTKSGLIANLEGLGSFPVSDFRTLLQIQALKELSARTGSRYKEYVKGHFNVTVSDARLDRPEYLGGYRVPINVIPVANTTGNGDDPQGNLSAFAVSDNGTRFAFSKAFEEHGFVIGLKCTSSDQSYQQGLERMWSRKNMYDFYDPLLANISEQAILQKELVAQGADVLTSDGTPVDDEVFGYQEAWAELRYKPNKITGKMRSTAEGTLDVWHLAPKLVPVEGKGIPLNDEFIESDTPVSRVVAVQDEPHFYNDNYFVMKCTRELPLYSVPSYLTGRM